MMVFVILALASVDAMSCDLCNSYLSINPSYNQNAIGLRWRTSSYSGMHSHTEIHDGVEHSHGDDQSLIETFNTYSLWGRMYLSPKLSLGVKFNYGFNYIELDGKVSEVIQGLGDLTLEAAYTVFNSDPDARSLSHRIVLGGGVKIPTGAFSERNNEGTVDPLMQPGTGSTDVLLSLAHLSRMNKLGLTLNAVYRMNTANRDKFQFANRFNATALFSYELEMSSWKIFPSLGGYYEQANTDFDDELELLNTGGEVIFAQLGADIYFNKVFLNIGYQIPLVERFNGDQAANNNRMMLGINYAFN